MPNIAAVLKDEIRRLARKEAKSFSSAHKKEITRLKKAGRELRALLDNLAKQIKRTATGAAPAPAKTEGAEVPWVRKSRMTGKTIRELRARLKLTQAELAKLLGVSGLAVYQWEHNEGTLNLRRKSREGLIRLRSLGLREAHRQLEQLGGAAPAEPKKKRAGRPKKAAKPAPAKRGRKPKKK